MAANPQIRVGFCVAYDWSLLEYSIPPIYEHSDLICLSVDKDRISWSGNPFSWDEQGFRAMVKRLDPQHKIQILEADYHIPSLQPMENEVRQRNKIAEFLGNNCWHIQLDTDEFFLNFRGFVDLLKSVNPNRKINISCPWITLYKKNDKGFFYVKPYHFKQIEFIQIATMHPAYEYGRRNGNFNILSDFALLHMSWARSEAEIWEKLNNWGHKNDFNIQDYFQRWQQLDETNYKTYINFHHIQPAIWPSLEFIAANSVEELIHKSEASLALPVSGFKLKLENSIWVSRAKKYLKFK